MASIATAVFPVWRSPMISSRWPRPTGIRLSIALRPVCIGSCTDLRGMMPGALVSTRRRSVAWIGPLPSIGLPSASTTRPSRPLPTGTSTIAPVRFTRSPSRIVRSSPKITTPTLSVSRLSAMPLMPPGNSTISPAWTESRPYTRAMPSPTDSTCPTSATSASVPKLAISCFRMEEISAGLISINRSLSLPAQASRAWCEATSPPCGNRPARSFHRGARGRPAGSKPPWRRSTP
jgi:hypothetical protein